MATKAELVEVIAEKAGLSKAAADKAFNAMLDSIASSLQKGDPVVLIGFGTFTVKERSEREGRNPQTGEKMTIKAAKVVGFKAGKSLKDSVKEGAVAG